MLQPPTSSATRRTRNNCWRIYFATTTRSHERSSTPTNRSSSVSTWSCSEYTAWSMSLRLLLPRIGPSERKSLSIYCLHYRDLFYITLFHQLNGSIKICKKSTLINITQQKRKKRSLSYRNCNYHYFRKIKFCKLGICLM